MKHGSGSNYGNSHGSSGQKSMPTKPLSHPPLSNGPNIQTLSPRSVQQPNAPPQTQVPAVPLTAVKSPPRRKPPPPMMDEFDSKPAEEPVETGGERGQRPRSANKYGEEVKEDLNRIIGTLEKEIDDMLVTGEHSNPEYSEYLHGDANQMPDYLIPETNALDISRSHQSEASYYSSHSHESPQMHPSTSYSDSSSQFTGTTNDNASFTPSDTPVFNSNEIADVPYPINASLSQSPTSPTFHSDVMGTQLPMVSDLNESRTSINSSIYSANNPEPDLMLKSIDTFDSNRSVPSQRNKEYQAAVSLNSLANSGASSRTTQNTPFFRSTSLQQSRNVANTAPQEPTYYDNSSKSKTSGARLSVSHHRKSSSVSSIWSGTSYRSVHMSKLKKSLELAPGEGERSNYVLSIRRNAGTAYNETPPGKWKLPIGILPVDNRIGNTANGRYLRLAGGVGQAKNKKTSGVELKHGHLQPRLLAAEVDDVDDEAPVGVQPLGRSGTDLTVSTGKSLPSELKSSESSITVGSTPSGSLLRNGSYGKTPNEDSQSMNDSSSTVPSSGRANSISSSSSESVADFNVGIGGYYQHPGYLHNDDDEETSTELESDFMVDREKQKPNDFNDYDARPRLVLANPDSSDESD